MIGNLILVVGQWFHLTGTRKIPVQIPNRGL